MGLKREDRTIEYEDFSIKIEPLRGDTYPVNVLSSPAGEGRSSFRLPFDPDEIGDILFDLGQSVRGSRGARLREAAPGATRTRPQQIGDQLFSALFSGPVSHLFHESLGMIRERQRGLRIKLHIDPEDTSLAKLASLPWELMYLKETRDFLNLSRSTPVLRYLDVQRPYLPLPLEPPLRILIVISSPADFQQLDLEKERRQIERTWAKQEGVAVDFVEAATVIELQDRLAEQRYHVLHYMGHGAFDRHSGQGVLVLEDEEGLGAPVDGSTLGVLLRDVPTMRLVFLNACETARVSKQVGLDPFAGVAAAMVMAGIPAVVAMQFPITDQAAIRFANRFYSLLACGHPVDYVVAEGRKAIRLAETGTMEWATPVLFMRAPEGVIFEVSNGQRLEVSLPELTEISEDSVQRLEELYTAGLSAFWLEEWDKAVQYFQAIVNVRPDHQDAEAKLEQARRRQKLHQLYEQAQTAQAAGDWKQAFSALEAIVAEAPDYENAAALLELARRQTRLAELYAQAQHLHQAGQWQAVTNVFAQIAALDPDYLDPNELLRTAERELAEQKRQAQLNDLYSRAVQEMDAGQWAEAQRLLRQVQEQEPAYLETKRLLARAESELKLERQQRAERKRREQTAGLYKEAQELAQAGQWRQALVRMGQIRALDPQFPDPEGIDAQARLELDREEEEARGQRELAALYADAVGLMQARRFQEALDKWAEVQAMDAAYPDRKRVQATAQKKLAARDRPVLWRRQPRGVWVAIGVVALIAVLVTGGIVLWPIITPTPSPTPTDTLKPTDTPATTPIATSTFAPTDTVEPTDSPTATPAAKLTLLPTLPGGPALPDPAPTNPVTGTIWEWSDGSAMVYVPAGPFFMGSSSDAPLASEDEKPRHRVILDAFWIDRTEVTNAQYRACVEAGECQEPGDCEWEGLTYGEPSKANYPVACVDWQDASAYCAWANKRLPTEAEWEKAARGTDERTFPWGEDLYCTHANFRSCVGGTVEVGSYPEAASPYGVLDMAGNVWEWVADGYDSAYYSVSPVENPQGPSFADAYVVRGGGNANEYEYVRAANRGWRSIERSTPTLGFRCALSADSPTSPTAPEPE